MPNLVNKQLFLTPPVLRSILLIFNFFAMFVNSQYHTGFNDSVEEAVQPEDDSHQREDVRHHVEIHARSKHGGATNVGKMEEESGAQLLACPNVFGQLVTFRQSAAMLLGTLFVIGLAVVDTHQ